LIDRPAIFDEENAECAADRCREMWELKYPSEPFDQESSCPSDADVEIRSSDIYHMVEKCRSLSALFSDAFLPETVYLVAAKSRYMDFLHLLKQYNEEGEFSQRLVPTADIHFMWLTHQVSLHFICSY
jgi:Glycine-rich domain-containing protein-like